MRKRLWILAVAWCLAAPALAQRASETNMKTCNCPQPIRVSALADCKTVCAAHRGSGRAPRGGSGGYRAPSQAQQIQGVTNQAIGLIQMLVPKGPSPAQIRQRQLREQARQERIRRERRESQERHEDLLEDLQDVGEGEPPAGGGELADLMAPPPTQKAAPAGGSVSPSCVASIDAMQDEAAALSATYEADVKKLTKKQYSSALKKFGKEKLKGMVPSKRAKKAHKLYSDLKDSHEKAEACAEEYDKLLACLDGCSLKRPGAKVHECLADCGMDDSCIMDLPEGISDARDRVNEGRKVLRDYAQALNRTWMKGFKNGMCIGKAQ